MSKGYLLGPNAARKLSRLLGNTKGVGETVSGGVVVDTQEWPDPFTIRWSATNAAWLMLKGIIQYNGAELEIEGEVPTGYSSPWIILGDIPAEASGMVYLNIDDESESGATASVSLEASGTLSIPLAEISRGNDSLAVEVKQHVRSALVIASGGGDARWKDPDESYYEETTE